MTVAFFYPLAWLGALALAAPLWLHLHRRQESNLVAFSALQFLDDQPIARRRPLWPRDLPLLLLRMAALLLLVAAFAWPFLPIDDERQTVTDSTVFVLDNTLSHQGAGKFPRARDALADRLRSIGSGRQTAVVVLESLPRVLARFSDSPSDAAARVAQLQPSAARGSYFAAIQQASELLKRSLGATRTIELFMDHQENQWREGADAAPFLVDVRLEFNQAEPPAPLANLAVWNPKAQRLYLGDTTVIQCAVQIFHQGPAREGELEWIVNGELIGRETIALVNQPEVVTTAVEWESTSNDWLRGEVRLKGSPDALDADNRAWFSLPPLREGTVDVAVQSRFLGTALNTDVLNGRWQVRKLDPMAPANENDADVLVVESSQLATPAMRDRLLKQRNGGRGVLLIIDEVPPAAVACLRDLGLELDDPTNLSPEKSEIRYYHADHPLFIPFATGEFGDLSRLRIHRYFPTRCARGLPILFAADGEPVFWSIPATGTLFVASFGLDRNCTDWPLLTSFVPFLDVCLGLARPSPPSREAYEPGEKCVWPVPSDQRVKNVSLRADKEVVATASVENGAARLNLPEAAGLFTVYYDDEREPQGILEINPSRHESRLTYTHPGDTIARWVVSGKTTEMAPPLATPPRGEASILRQRIWWWLLIGGIVTLCGETCWLAWRKERR